jgi:predicted RNase H-like HicB family nuclease
MQDKEEATTASIIKHWQEGKASGTAVPLNLSETRKEAQQRLKKTMSRDRYTYRVTWSQEDSKHLGLCLEFPSLSWVAATPEEALSGIHKIVADVIVDMQSSGESAPQPLPASQAQN